MAFRPHSFVPSRPPPGVGASPASLAAVILAGQPATASASTPPGFSESTVFSGLNLPTNLRFSPDGRVFVAEKSGLIKVFDSAHDTTPTVFADLRTEVYNYWDRGLLGTRARPASSRPSPTSTSSTPTTRRSAGTRPVWGTPGASDDDCPTPPGPTTDGCVVSGRLSRLTANGRQGDRVRAGADQRLVPAVPEPLDRRPGVRPRRRTRSTSAAARARASTRTDYGQLGRQPLRRPARRRRRRRRARPAPRAARCAARARDDPPVSPGRSTARSCASIPTPATGCPATRSRTARTPTPAGSSPTGFATRSASRSDPVRRALGRRRRLVDDRGDRPDRQPARRARRRTSAGPATRDRSRSPSYRAAGLNLCQSPLRDAGRRHRAVLQLPARAPRSFPARPARRAARRSAASPSIRTAGRIRRATTGRCSSPTTRATASG